MPNQPKPQRRALPEFRRLFKSLAFASTLGFFASGLGGCGLGSDVTVETPAPEIKYETILVPKFDEKALAAQALTQDVEAFTTWMFSCKADIVTEVVSSDGTDGGATIALKVTHVNIRTALPIVIHLPAKPRAGLKEHEDGHAEICALAYGKAGEVAYKAGKEVVGQTYNGMGKNLDEARAMALDQAQRVISSAFQEGTTAIVNQASEKYDEYCRHFAMGTKLDNLTLAKNAYENIINIPVQVLK